MTDPWDELPDLEEFNNPELSFPAPARSSSHSGDGDSAFGSGSGDTQSRSAASAGVGAWQTHSATMASPADPATAREPQSTATSEQQEAGQPNPIAAIQAAGAGLAESEPAAAAPSAVPTAAAAVATAGASSSAMAALSSPLSMDDMLLLESAEWLTSDIPTAALAGGAAGGSGRPLRRGFSGPPSIRSNPQATADVPPAAAQQSSLAAAAGAAFLPETGVPPPPPPPAGSDRMAVQGMQEYPVFCSGLQQWAGSQASLPMWAAQGPPRLGATSLPSGGFASVSQEILRSDSLQLAGSHIRGYSSTGSMQATNLAATPRGLSMQASMSHPFARGLQGMTPVCQPPLMVPDAAHMGPQQQQSLPTWETQQQLPAWNVMQFCPEVQQALEAVIALPLGPNTHQGLPVVQHLCRALHPRMHTVVADTTWLRLQAICLQGAPVVEPIMPFESPFMPATTLSAGAADTHRRTRRGRQASVIPQLQASSNGSDESGSKEDVTDTTASAGAARKASDSLEGRPAKLQRTGGQPKKPRKPVNRHRPDRQASSESGKRPPNNPWTLTEHWALVNATAQIGINSRHIWADIKRLQLPDLESRSTVDLKDKWRNLQRIARLSPSAMRTKCAKKSETPLELVHRVKQLTEQGAAEAAAEAAAEGGRPPSTRTQPKRGGSARSM